MIDGEFRKNLRWCLMFTKSNEGPEEVFAPKKNVFTTTEAGRICGLGRTTMNKRFDAERIQGSRLSGGRRLIPRAELLRFMKNSLMPTDDVEKVRVGLLVSDALHAAVLPLMPRIETYRSIELFRYKQALHPDPDTDIQNIPGVLVMDDRMATDNILGSVGRLLQTIRDAHAQKIESLIICSRSLTSDSGRFSQNADIAIGDEAIAELIADLVQ